MVERSVDEFELILPVGINLNRLVPDHIAPLPIQRFPYFQESQVMLS